MRSPEKGQSGQRSAFERFEELLRRLLAVPKQELDRRRARYPGKRPQNPLPRRTTRELCRTASAPGVRRHPVRRKRASRFSKRLLVS